MNSLGIMVLLLVIGLLLSLNPFSISVFSSLLAGSLGKGHTRAKMQAVASAYLITYWILTALLGAILVIIFSNLTAKSLQILALVIGCLSILWGMVTLKHYFWNKSRSRIPLKLHGHLHVYTVKKNSPVGSAVLGVLACLVSFGSVGLQLLALAAVVTMLAPTAPLWMLLPAACLILPLKLIFLQVLNGFKISAIIKWKNETSTVMQLGLALVNIALGWLIFLILNGSIGSAL